MKKFLALQVAAVFASGLLFAQETVEQWQKKTVEDFPEIGVGGSPMNVKFVQEVTASKSSNPALFNNPKWPYLIAEQIANPKKPEPSIIPGLDANPQKSTALDPSKIASEFKSDPIAANAKYFGKRVELSGEILRVARPDNSTSIAFVYLKTDNGLPCVKVELNRMKKYGGKSSEGFYHTTKEGYEFQITDASVLEVRSHNRYLNRSRRYYRNTVQNGDWFPIVSKGETITVVGTCGGLKYDVILNACELQKDDDDLP